MKKTFSEILKDFKTKHLITSDQLAQIIGLSPSMTVKYLAGTYIGSDRKQALMKLAMDAYEKRTHINESIVSEAEVPYNQKEVKPIEYSDLWKMVQTQLNIIGSQQDTIQNLSKKT